MHVRLALGLAAVSSLVLAGDSPPAEACGCLSPPAVSEGEYAVNQSAEQIIFEVEPGWVTAHVLIRYSGDPAQFAWIIPVPEVPELGISPASAFGLIDRASAPDIGVQVDNLCPISEWSCRFADTSCGGLAGDSAPFADAGAATDASDGTPPPVTVLGEEVVGDYETVTFRASEAAAATQWLRDNGFLVNPTTSIYMESYVQANMVFVAAKLVPGAGAQAIKPLRLKYRAAFPMIPLVLTAVAAQPDLTVTSYLYSDSPFRPMGHPVVSIDPDRLARDGSGRLNYPMVLARTIDDAGGDGFAVEYRGGAPQPQFGQQGFCCGNGFDTCGIGGDGVCQCPADDFDQGDCGSVGDLVDGVALVQDLAARHAWMTRLTTRVSPEDMTFDPTFEPDRDAQATGALSVRGHQASLTGCAAQVIDQTTLTRVNSLQACATTYCGPGGSCAITDQGAAGCACDSEHVAQRFVDLDGKPSVTCVPRVPTCDLRAGGDVLPDACANTSCGHGSCIDRNGIAVCACDDGAAAIPGLGDAPHCDLSVLSSGTPGAEDYSEPLRTLDVCAAPPPSCGEDGWLERVQSPRPGVDCGAKQPAIWDMWPKPDKHCGPFGCVGCQTDDEMPWGALAGAWIVLGLVVLRRRRTR